MSAGALLGLLVGVGLISVWLGVKAHRRPRLVDRLDRRDRTRPVRERGPLGVLVELLGPSLNGVMRRFSTESSDGSTLRNRLRKAGMPDDVSRYRLEQLLWAASGLGAAVVLAIIVSARGGSANPILFLILAVAGVLGAMLMHDRRVSSRIRKRGERMDQQLPTAAELLAFAVAAGEPPVVALERVGTTTEGDLAWELRETVADVRGGMGFVPALTALTERAPSASVSRFVDGIVVAAQRGTPMSEVLRAQAADARAAGHRRLMESSSKREVLMLTPVVFLVLPIVVVIALFPGIHGLNLTIP